MPCGGDYNPILRGFTREGWELPSMGSALNAAHQVLAEAGEPLHYKEIARRVLEGDLWQTDGKTPEATVSAQLTVHIKKHGKNAKFRRVGSGIFALNEPAPSASPTASSATRAPTLPRAVGRSRSRTLPSKSSLGLAVGSRCTIARLRPKRWSLA